MIPLRIPCKYRPVSDLQSDRWLLGSGCCYLAIAVAAILYLVNAHALCAAEPGTPNPGIEQRVQELIPELDDYIASGMKAFDVPGAAIGILVGDKLVYTHAAK
jgi:hypothetical protein